MLPPSLSKLRRTRSSQELLAMMEEAQGPTMAETTAEPAPDAEPRRRLSLRDQIDCVPVYVVWEITLACNLKCIHCGSRAGHRRAKEALNRRMHRRGAPARRTRHPRDLDHRRRGLRSQGLADAGSLRSAIMASTAPCRPAATSCRADMIEAAAEAGLLGLGVSVDGLEPLARPPARRPRLLPRGAARARRLPQHWPHRQRQHPDHLDGHAAACRN